MSRSSSKDWFLERPGVDQGAALIVAAGAGFVTAWLPADTETRITLYSALAGLCGLVLAAATFVCTLTYQSNSHLMKKVRVRFGQVLARNWTAIIATSFAAALVALLALVLDEVSARAASAAVAYSVATILASFARVVVWLRYTLFFEEVAEKFPEPVAVEFNPAKRSAG